jgi:predicted porin
MKKLLIATAALAMVAGTAQAQSTVTVYGAIGYGIEQNDLAAGSTTTATQGSNGLGTSVIGLRGSEDLGGGLKANFNLEGGLNTPDGTLGSTNSNTTTTANTNQLFNRQSWVGISSTQFGAIQLGRQNTATKDIEGFGDVGTNLMDVGGAVDSYTDRFGTTARYETPTISGFKAVITNTQGLSAAAAYNAVEAGQEINAYNIQYSAGKLKLAYGEANSKTAAGFKANNTLWGASYDAGFATFEAAYQTEKPDADGTDKLTQFGAIVPVGKQYDVRVAYASLDVAGATATDITYMGVMGVYHMSKRTRAFIGYRDASYGAGGEASDAKLTTVGLIHAF